MYKFSKNDQDKIKEAVKKAESKTSGEIVTAFIKESDSYAIYELTFSFACGFIYFIILLFFSVPIEKLLMNIFWDYSTKYLLAFYGFSIFFVISIVYFLTNISFIDRLIINKKIMRQKVRERALRYFIEAGVLNTKDRTGILIFISYLERRVELIADSGISDKISEAQWVSITKTIINGIKAKKFIPNLCESIVECGKLLQKHFPIKKDDVNELANDINILEK